MRVVVDMPFPTKGPFKLKLPFPRQLFRVDFVVERIRDPCDLVVITGFLVDQHPVVAHAQGNRRVDLEPGFFLCQPHPARGFNRNRVADMLVQRRVVVMADRLPHHGGIKRLVRNHAAAVLREFLDPDTLFLAR